MSKEVKRLQEALEAKGIKGDFEDLGVYGDGITVDRIDADLLQALINAEWSLDTSCLPFLRAQDGKIWIRIHAGLGHTFGLTPEGGD